MSKKDKVVFPDPSELKEEIMAKYPKKVARKRAKGFVTIDPEIKQEIQANVRTIPGIITQRGCCYAGCKGVVLGPTRDTVNLTHGPIGCGFYSWLTRRNQTDPGPDGDNFMTYCFSTDMQDSNVVFGGEKKLAQAIKEAYEIVKPHSISVFSTCPVGLIGDDIHTVCRKMKEELGINVFGFSCEGYKGVTQSAGHHIANNRIFTDVVGIDNEKRPGKYRMNLLGEYNIGGDAFEIERYLDEIGVTLVSTYSGNSSIRDFENSHMVDLNVVMCHRSINYIAEMMEKKYGIPWFKVNFIGAEATAKSLRKIAEYFEDDEMKAKVEKLIESEMKPVQEAIAKAKPHCEGKLAMIFVGGSRAHHYQTLFGEIGMTTVSAGYEFAHRDDYEGRDVLPDLKVDADSRNIEELDVEKDEKYFREDLPAKKEKLVANKFIFSDYDGMMTEMEKNTLAIDDISQWESEKIIEFYKPAVFCAGIKEKYVIQKLGVPMKQLHSYDYGGPFAGFKGAVNFFTEIDRIINTNVWSLITPPWKDQPEIVAKMADSNY